MRVTRDWISDLGTTVGDRDPPPSAPSTVSEGQSFVGEAGADIAGGGGKSVANKAGEVVAGGSTTAGTSSAAGSSSSGKALRWVTGTVLVA